MILGSRPRLKECRLLNLRADNTNIQNVSAQKLLGLYVDNSYHGLNILITYALSFHQKYHF